MILAGDVGGTKTRLAFYQLEEGRMIQQQTDTFVSRDYSCLEEVVQIFINKYEVSVTKSCFGVPGPVINGEAKATKLPWHFKEEQISRDLNIPTVKLVNDLVATAAAVPHLMPEDLFVLHEGEPLDSNIENQQHNSSKRLEKREATIGVLAPGTGLGQAFLYTNSGQRYIMASEGGHADFAPTTEIEVELFQYLKSKYSHVSYDRILSGPGLVNIYTFLKERGFAPETPELNKRLREEDPGRVITSKGKTGEYELCAKALDIFASILGAQAGNLVLTLMTTEGVYLGGGIPAGIHKKLADGTAVNSYLNKGRLSYLVKNTPLYIILDDHAALLGAAYLASEL
ncbi:MAG: Glucokinase [Candidatus Scalindua rubra]|uniref:Glucokinase n=1 Tax=Candidatus Scalindua rubra TaxID=1872076 RepID=A0A1E3X8C7_9BACT|nr:MAG: Glucokinase [Candidatus Scalindua rubra]